MVKFRILAQAGVAALAMLAAAPAFAQFFPGQPYPQPQSYYQQQRPYYPPPEPEYQQPQQPYYPQQQPYYQQRPDYGYRPRRPPQVSNLCGTSRGVCYINVLAPVSAPCRCEVPGFGLKRGNVIAR